MTSALPKNAPRILLVADDLDLRADIQEALDLAFHADVSALNSAGEAASLGGLTDFDVLIADAGANDSELPGLLTDATTGGLPAILIDDQLVAERILGALRLGVIDVLTRPVDFRHLERVVSATLEARQIGRRADHRQRRLRQLSSRMVRDRRELRRRIDLLCKDLVGAYRRLAERIAAHEERVMK